MLLKSFFNKLKGKDATFLKNKVGYTLERSIVDKIKQEVSADKTTIKKALKDGIVIDGVKLVENQNLQLK